jgi:MFS family permease
VRLLARIYELCGTGMCLIAFITQPDSVAVFLTYLGDRGRMMQPDCIGPLPGAAGLALPVERQSPPTSRFGGRHPLHDTDPATRSLRNDPADARRRGEKLHPTARRACDRGIEPPILHRGEAMQIANGGAGTTAVSRSYENRLVFILALGCAVAALDAQALFFLSPYVADAFGLNNTQIGLLASVVLISWSLSGYVVGRLSDRSGRRKPWLVGAFLMFAACSMLSGLAATFALLFAARLLIGVAEGPVIPISQFMVARYSSPQRRGLNMGIVQNLGAQLVGTLIAPLLLVQIAERWSWNAAFYIAGVPALIVALLIALYVQEPPREEASATTASGSGRVLRMLAVRNVRLCVLIACCVVAWYFMLLTYLPLYCVRLLGITSTQMSYVMAAMGAAGAVSPFAVSALSDYYGRRRIIIVFAALSIVVPLSALFVGDSLWLLIALVFLGSLVLGTVPLFMGTIPMESLPAAEAATGMGLVLCVGQIVGGFFGPLLGGVLADRFSLAVPLWITVAAGIVGALLATRLIETAPRLVQRGAVQTQS